MSGKFNPQQLVIQVFEHQYPLRFAIWISLARALKTKDRLWAALGFAILNAIIYGIISDNLLYAGMISFFFSFAITYLSAIPWRWRVLPKQAAPLLQGIATTIVLLLIGPFVFFLCLLIPGLFYFGVERMIQIIPNMLPTTLNGLIFSFVGFWLVTSEEAERNTRVMQARDARLERLAEEARLVALRAQINPHFFFNTLNTIAALIPERPSDAERAVELLATSLRPVLMRDQPMKGTLRSELEIVEAYADIEKLRLGDRVNFQAEVQPEALDCQLPSLSLQPLVENAIVHGAAKSQATHLIHLKADVEDSTLRISVSNRQQSDDVADSDMIKIEPEDGHAIHNIASRLKALFGNQASLKAESNGTSAKVFFTVPVERETQES